MDFNHASDAQVRSYQHNARPSATTDGGRSHGRAVLVKGAVVTRLTKPAPPTHKARKAARRQASAGRRASR